MGDLYLKDDDIGQSTLKRYDIFTNTVVSLEEAFNEYINQVDIINQFIDNNNLDDISKIQLGNITYNRMSKYRNEIENISQFSKVIINYDVLVDDKFKEKFQDAIDDLSDITEKTISINKKSKGSIKGTTSLEFFFQQQKSLFEKILKSKYEQNKAIFAESGIDLSMDEYLDLICEMGDFIYENYDYGAWGEASAIVDYIPYIGSVKSLYQLLVGVDPVILFSGKIKYLTWEERLSQIPYVIGIKGDINSIAKGGKSIEEMSAEIIEKCGKRGITKFINEDLDYYLEQLGIEDPNLRAMIKSKIYNLVNLKGKAGVEASIIENGIDILGKSAIPKDDIILNFEIQKNMLANNTKMIKQINEDELDKLLHGNNVTSGVSQVYNDYSYDDGRINTSIIDLNNIYEGQDKFVLVYRVGDTSNCKLDSVNQSYGEGLKLNWDTGNVSLSEGATIVKIEPSGKQSTIAEFKYGQFRKIA